MRLSPDSQHMASYYLQQGYDAQSTTNEVNRHRPGRIPYQADDIRQFRQNQNAASVLGGLPQRGRGQSGQSHVPRASINQPTVAPTLDQQITQLQDERSYLANVDGRIDHRIAELQDQLRNPAPPPQSAPAGSGGPAASALTHYSQADLTRELIARRNPQDFAGAPLPSGIDSRATGSTYDSRYSDASGQLPPSSLASSSRAPATVTNSSREGRQVAAAPYPPPSQRSRSSATTVKPINCSHKPGGVVNTDTFVGCDVTDDELKQGDKKALDRVARRKSMYQKAQKLGVTTTGAVDRAEKDARAAAKGFTSRQAAERAARDARAAAKGFPSRQAAEHAARDALAAARGFPSRQAAERAARDVRAARQLGSEAMDADLARIQAGERALAERGGMSVNGVSTR